MIRCIETFHDQPIGQTVDRLAVGHSERSEESHLVSGFQLIHQMLMLDANLVDTVPTMESCEVVRRLVDRLLADLGMTELGKLEFFEAADLRAPGWSFIQPITTSHISGHYFEMPGEPPRIHIDVYSCRPFDCGATLHAAHALLNLAEWVATWVVRDMDLRQRATVELHGRGSQIRSQDRLK